MLQTYGEIRLSIDLTRVEDTRYVILYDFFTSKRIAIFTFCDWDDQSMKDFFSYFIKKEYNITYIVTIRNISPFRLIPYLKSIAPDTTKFISYNKF